MRKFFKYSIVIILSLLALILICAGYLFAGKTPETRGIVWGVNFAQNQAEILGLDWKETYLAILEDLNVKEIKLINYWDIIEGEKDKFYFDDLDWQIKEAENHQAKLIMVIGMKTGRWTECHLPQWAKSLTKEEQQKEVLELLEKIVLRYKGSNSVWAWQVENEPLFSFGECPWKDKNFLKKEVEFVKSLDNRPVIVSDSGEFSLWIEAARLGDIVGTTLYRKTWSTELRSYITYPFPAVYYWKRVLLINKLFKKEVICIELQTEPWGPKLLPDISVQEQLKTMDLEQFRKNISFAKETGLKKFYFWGVEWWYWMKETQGHPEIWDEAKTIFNI